MSSGFELLHLNQSILKGIFTYGYSSPSSIQERVIPEILKGSNVVVQSKNGTGKTATFLLGMLQRVSEGIEASNEKRGIYAVILQPTRDLAVQTFSVFSGLGKYTEVKGYCAVGGHSVSNDLQALTNTKIDVLCGTPGRVLQLIKERPKLFQSTKMLIIDEVDRVLDTGFGEQVVSILDSLKKNTPQYIFVSATLPKRVTEMLENLMDSPKMFLMPQETLAVDKITQYYLFSSQEERFHNLCEILGSISVSQAIIFGNRKETVIDLEKSMKVQDFPVTALHSALEQEERNKRISSFLAGKERMLISTDVASRGLDAANVNLVVNYELPPSSEEYLHRIGRGGRFGKSSIGITFILPEEEKVFRSICTLFGKKPLLWSFK
ncbi:ATP-dependent RNA helicase [Nematocida sp. LUAm3]|nr:ATP-dependent RNA helicase [Nematocida sp. LUAm3]KAI5177972.1 ATP-dependent RNA helicase [Nematocida sp. LUAm1]